MSQNQFRPWQVLAALLQSRSTLLLRCLATLLVVALNIHSGVALADNAAASNPTAIQKLRANFDALAKKEIPEKKDWKGLYEACSGLFEIRDFSRIFGCVGIAERWQAKVGEEPFETKIFGEKYSSHEGYPTMSSVLLIEAKAQLEMGHSSKAIKLAKRALAEDKRVLMNVLGHESNQYATDCSVSLRRTGEVVSILIESNLLLATTLFIEGKRGESAPFQRIVEECTNFPRAVSNKGIKASKLSFRTRL